MVKTIECLLRRLRVSERLPRDVLQPRSSEERHNSDQARKGTWLIVENRLTK